LKGHALDEIFVDFATHKITCQAFASVTIKDACDFFIFGYWSATSKTHTNGSVLNRKAQTRKQRMNGYSIFFGPRSTIEENLVFVGPATVVGAVMFAAPREKRNVNNKNNMYMKEKEKDKERFPPTSNPAPSPPNLETTLLSCMQARFWAESADLASPLQETCWYEGREQVPTNSLLAILKTGLLLLLLSTLLKCKKAETQEVMIARKRLRS